MDLRVALALVLLVTACHPGRASSAPVVRPEGPLTAEEAGRYVLSLVNRDRAEAGLGPVEWDDVAERAAARHVEDMTRNGYAGHWGTDGSVPEERYTRAGGVHLVQENAACFSDAERRELEPEAKFDAAALEKIQAAFMAEKPPHDGHRKNILKKWHTKVGVAVARPVGISQPCLVQEFVDEYGSYGELPKSVKAGQVVTVSGEVRAPATFGGVGISRIDPAKPIAVKELLERSSYPMPEPFELHLTPGFQIPGSRGKQPKPVSVSGKRFTIDVPLRGRPGRYGVSVWATFPGDDALVMVSLRVIDVR